MHLIFWFLISVRTETEISAFEIKLSVFQLFKNK